MFLGNFFTISDKTVTDTHVAATIEINASHEIFKGHFPDQPVVPGVCMVQMIKEILETIITKSLQLKSAAELKFLAVINPLENPSVKFDLTYEQKEDGSITAGGRLLQGEITFLKFKTEFISVA